VKEKAEKFPDHRNDGEESFRACTMADRRGRSARTHKSNNSPKRGNHLSSSRKKKKRGRMYLLTKRGGSRTSFQEFVKKFLDAPSAIKAQGGTNQNRSRRAFPESCGCEIERGRQQLTMENIRGGLGQNGRIGTKEFIDGGLVFIKTFFREVFWISRIDTRRS